MAGGKGIILGLAGIGVAAVVLKSMSTATTASPAKQQTYVDKTLTRIQKQGGGKVAKAKGYVQRGTAEAQAAINAVNKILKS